MDIFNRHREVFHYTSARSAIKIINSNIFFSTRFSDLNDQSEMKMFRRKFEEKLFPFLYEKTKSRFRFLDTVQQIELGKVGGSRKAAENEAKRIVSSFYNTSLGGGDKKPGLTVPYVTSFCSHTDDQEYEQQNGLLSQWRGYASEGCAIVFDTKELYRIFISEYEDFDYSAPSMMGDIVYDGNEKKFDEEFGTHIIDIKNIFLRHYESSDKEIDIVDSSIKFLSMMVRFKHRAFEEEREVRMTQFPMTSEIEQRFFEADKQYRPSGKPKKKIFNHNDGRQYIKSLGPDYDDLPVKRIIVAPSKNQSNIESELRSGLTGSFKLVLSDTPFIG